MWIMHCSCLLLVPEADINRRLPDAVAALAVPGLVHAVQTAASSRQRQLSTSTVRLTWQKSRQVAQWFSEPTAILKMHSKQLACKEPHTTASTPDSSRLKHTQCPLATFGGAPSLQSSRPFDAAQFAGRASIYCWRTLQMAALLLDSGGHCICYIMTSSD